MSSCNITGCSGTYEDREITHTERHQGEIVVVDHVPAQACDICGDKVLSLSTVRALETLLQNSRPTGAAALYDYQGQC